MKKFKGLNIPLKENLPSSGWSIHYDDEQIQFKYCNTSIANGDCRFRQYSCENCLFHIMNIMNFKEWYKISIRSKKLERIVNEPI